MVGLGLSDREIAERMGIKVKGVRKHVAGLRRDVRCASRVALVEALSVGRRRSA